jgi:hypothetical protein
MIQRRATLNEIVTASGLSRATVDRVINNRPGVHPRTRDLVARIVAELEKRQPKPMRRVLPCLWQTSIFSCAFKAAKFSPMRWKLC